MGRLGYLFLIFCGLFVQGQLQLSPLFSDHMLLQQQSEAAIWGTTEPNATVTITVDWCVKPTTTVADASGSWKTTIKTTQGTFVPHWIRLESGREKLELKDVLIGEVWLSSGQSNMELVMRRVEQAETEIQKANKPFIRLFQVKRGTASEPQFSFPSGSKWAVCTPESVKEFSAMSYYYACKLQEKLQIPVGIINANWGGTGAESWTPATSMNSEPKLASVYDRWKLWETNRTTDSLAYDQLKLSNPKAELPRSLYMLKRLHRRPSVLFNAMIHPIIPYTIKGFIWYQGTSNREWAYEYTDQMKALITGWRQSWANAKLPFYFLQLTAYGYSDSHLANVIRESQVQTLQLPYTALATTLDLGDMGELHPKNKKPFGERLAAIALNETYQQNKDLYCGPLLVKTKFKKGKAILRFKHDEWLQIATDTPKSLYIAGEDQHFYPATAFLKKKLLYVYANEVPHPVAVRYNWNNCPQTYLFNAANLPASPFRTDQWNEVRIPEWAIPVSTTPNQD
ncbi:MAG: hypothetical protein CFE24_06460 [Flavobacterium sp. BFFFF2]|nr:MAG: hypothetical protein CFE24_06460 [Flavobacterium sp. BFFFF2]